jgi:hypothetical protein
VSRRAKDSVNPTYFRDFFSMYANSTLRETTRIGTQIFNRGTGYNPGEDNIVRSYARMLRKRLDEYFEDEGSEEPMRIVIPRGGYIPVFMGCADTNPRTTDLRVAIEGAPMQSGPSPYWSHPAHPLLPPNHIDRYHGARFGLEQH